MTAELDVKGTMQGFERANVLISYSGYISDQTLEGISQGIKAIFESGPTKTRKSRKVFSVFVESAQNIIIYSGRRMAIEGTRDGAGYGAIFIQTTGEDTFSVLSSTIVLADKKDEFEGRLNSLMAMSDEEIDAAYEDQLMNEITGSEKGAGLGLFEIRRQVKKLNFEFEPDGEDFMLVMRADI